jgi:hypothetical protein
VNDFEATDARLKRLRSDVGEQFNYTFSLRARNATIRIRGSHNAELAKEIIEA